MRNLLTTGDMQACCVRLHQDCCVQRLLLPLKVAICTFDKMEKLLKLWELVWWHGKDAPIGLLALCSYLQNLVFKCVDLLKGF